MSPFPPNKKIDELRLNSAPPSIVAPRSLRSPSHAGHGHAWGRRTAAQRGGRRYSARTGRRGLPMRPRESIKDGYIRDQSGYSARFYLHRSRPRPLPNTPPRANPDASVTTSAKSSLAADKFS
jgi:hypothetical protein